MPNKGCISLDFLMVLKHLTRSSKKMHFLHTCPVYTVHNHVAMIVSVTSVGNIQSVTSIHGFDLLILPVLKEIEWSYITNRSIVESCELHWCILIVSRYIWIFVCICSIFVTWMHLLISWNIFDFMLVYVHIFR